MRLPANQPSASPPNKAKTTTTMTINGSNDHLQD
jgi:hypothetical protein